MKQIVQDILGVAGVGINGSGPCDIRVHNNELYERVLSQGSLGLGESYMDGWWDCNSLDGFFNKVLVAKLEDRVSSRKIVVPWLKSKFLNMQNKKRSLEVGLRHYDVGNELYRSMLDKRMTYTCGYWKDVDNLDDAQESKLDLVCRKVGLKPGMKVLDIGCGWGSFAKYAAEKYGVSVVGVTISKEQVKLGRDACKDFPVDLRFQDYRDVNERFDAVVSLGMFEHVGFKNYRTYMEKVAEYLEDDGLFLLHTIGGLKSKGIVDPWIEKYIFPNSVLPSMGQITKASLGIFVNEDFHNFGADYDKTLMSWHENFEKGWETLSEIINKDGTVKYDERFKRMWDYYLLISAGSFRSRKNQLWQIVFSKGGVKGGYESVR